MGLGEMSPGAESIAGAIAGVVVAQMVIAAYVLVAYLETKAIDTSHGVHEEKKDR